MFELTGKWKGTTAWNEGFSDKGSYLAVRSRSGLFGYRSLYDIS